MSKRHYIVDLLASYTDPVTAELIVERLTDEGLLNLGYGDADVDMVMNTFQESFGTTKTSKPDRWAANRLVKKYGAQSICGIIKILASRSDNRFAPVVNSVTELETKWVSVLAFVRKNSDTTIET